MSDLIYPPPLPPPKVVGIDGQPLLPELPKFEIKPKVSKWVKLGIFVMTGLVLVLLLLWALKPMLSPPIPHLGFSAGTPVENVNSTQVRVTYRVDDEMPVIPVEFWLNNELKSDNWTVETGQNYFTDLELPYQEFSEVRLIAKDQYGNIGQSTLTIRYVDVRPPQIVRGIEALGPSPCVTRAHVASLPCPPTYLYEEVWSAFTNAGGNVFNHTIKPGIYDADYWSNTNITRVYLEFGCWNFNNQNYTFKMAANKPGNFTEISYWSEPKNATNYTSSLKSASWVNWC